MENINAIINDHSSQIYLFSMFFKKFNMIGRALLIFKK